jgi:hypothetical protein
LGQVRIRYKPFFEVTGKEQIPVIVNEELVGNELTTVYTANGKRVDPEEVLEGPEGPYVEGKDIESVAYEQVCAEFVPWERFGWDTDASTWSDVRWAWIEYHLTAKDLQEQFKMPLEEIKKLPESSKDADGKSLIGQRFKVYEVFDKEGRQVHVWIEGREDPLSEADDPYHLEGFFPFPKPLLGTVTSDKLIPVPNYQIAQDLYTELNEVCRRIHALVRQLKVRGAYDAQYKEQFEDILHKDDGYMVSMANFTEAQDKGGIGKALAFLPLEEINAVLQTLMHHRTSLINLIGQIEGTTDTARGQGRASESAAAAEIKNQHYGVRTNREVRKVARFVRDVFRLISEFIAENFGAETFSLISQTEISEEEFQLLRSDLSRKYMVNVQTDSMQVEDEQAESELRGTATNAISAFLAMAMPYVQQGAMSPEAAKAMVLYNVRASSRGRGELEKVVESMFPPPPPQQPGVMPPGPPPQ